MAVSLRRRGMEHTFPHLLVQDPSFRGQGAFLRVEGRTRPVAVRAPQSDREWSLEAVYPRTAQKAAQRLLWLLEASWDAPDARVRLRVDSPREDTLHESPIMEIHEWSQRREGGGILYVDFDSREVDDEAFSLNLVNEGGTQGFFVDSSNWFALNVDPFSVAKDQSVTVSALPNGDGFHVRVTTDAGSVTRESTQPVPTDTDRWETIVPISEDSDVLSVEIRGTGGTTELNDVQCEVGKGSTPFGPGIES